MKRNSIKSLVLVVAFSLALFAGANETFAITKENNGTVKEMVVKAPETKLKGVDNAKAKGGKANAYGKSENKLTGIENARAHGGNAYAHGDDEAEDEAEVVEELVDEVIEEVVVEDTTVIVDEVVVTEVDDEDESVVEPVIEAPKLKGIENARAHGGNAHAYGHSKKIEVLPLVQ